ncbi:glucokinase [Mucilaginibacter lappiensis]|uniref:Glucokinase n=1 Tax=Mucilaginibacter lappiensis TaxID=354630 RepID=A0ABR6PQ80_9SPHI|nr:ROK family protein [Mucilaginibacter lappiensis]MBB6111933.1 glucokinase [Mucilaginibacter lappiensis]SIR90609.1 glucokinase [Mucilaginibacter lappiensis]
MSNIKIIGLDLGATNIRGAVVNDGSLSDIVSQKIRTHGSVDDVMEDIYKVTDALLQKDKAEVIGIGVPSVVDVAEGIVYDVQNIPSWKEVHLKQLMETRYNIPVYVNNDANCFALGEYYFGKGNGSDSMIGLTLGTGLGAGVMINNRLYPGFNCGAGEFGMFPYLDNILEYYCSGSFFSNVYGLDGVQVFEDANRGGDHALKLYSELGIHIGHAIKQVMYAYDPQLIVLGGSVRHAYALFEQTMWQEIKTFAYTKTAERIRVEVSELENSGIIGAAALYYDHQQ